jgi:glutamate-1-semialdehyde aminotransferase
MTSFKGFKNSLAMYENAKELYPGGGRLRGLIPGISPIYASKGKGSKLWDVDGNKYIDYTLAFGPIILGYANPRVNQAVNEIIEKGTLYVLYQPTMDKLAKKLNDIVPNAERVLFYKTGSEATSAAVRIARAHTGKDKIIRCGFHGWHDWAGGMWITQTKGIPQVIKDLTINWREWGRDYCSVTMESLDELEDLLKKNEGKVSCIVLALEMFAPPLRDTLRGIKQLASEHNTVLIFDEVKTGFRTALGGVQECEGVEADITTFSKGMANGFPMAATVGKKEIMEIEGEMYVGGTFGNEAVGAVAALATIQELEEKQGPQHIKTMGERLLKGLNDLCQDIGVNAEAYCTPYPAMPNLNFKNEVEKLRIAQKIIYTKQLANRGVLVHPEHLWFISMSHSKEDIDETIEASGDSLRIIKDLLY